VFIDNPRLSKRLSKRLSDLLCTKAKAHTAVWCVCAHTKGKLTVTVNSIIAAPKDMVLYSRPLEHHERHCEKDVLSGR
jgi:hypothetical protein